MTKAQRYKLLDSSAELSIRQQSKLLKIPRGKYYYQLRNESPQNQYLMDLIDRQYQRTPFMAYLEWRII